MEALFKVVTPLFLGGADPENEKVLGIRAPSIKGALRFWYRAIALGRLGSLEEVRKKEAELFGSTSTGQSAFLLRVVDEKLETVGEGKRVLNGNAYLGYGIAEWNKNARANLTTRSYIEPGSTFKLRLQFRPKNKGELEKSDRDDLKLAIIALGLFGGLGARSRRGFGSLALMSLTENSQVVWSAPQTVNELRLKYEEFFRELSLRDEEELPGYTAFSRYSRVAIVATDANAERLHSQVGQNLNRYRSYRSNPSNYPRDHDIVRKVADRIETQEHPVRLAFGLPHNYFFSSDKTNVSISGKKGKEEYRRASPLFIHIHPIGREFAAVLTFIPAKFLPDPVEIEMTARGNRVQVSCAIKNYEDFHPIIDFIDSFPHRMEVSISE